MKEIANLSHVQEREVAQASKTVEVESTLISEKVYYQFGGEKVFYMNVGLRYPSYGLNQEFH